MTIKKTISIKRPAMGAGPQASAAGEAGASSAASAVANRYRLDTSDAPKKKGGGGGGIGTTITLLAAMAALIVAGILTFRLYDYWEMLKGA